MALSVLLVDDHAAFRRRTRQLLEAEGYAVAGEASDGTKGVERALELRPGLVLLDVHLPDALGFDLVSRMPAPVILISTHDESAYRRRALDSGALGFITKDELAAATIEALLA